MNDLINRQVAIKLAIDLDYESRGILKESKCREIENRYNMIPSAETGTCEGCKHLGKWESEVEYGYPSPCTRCKRRVKDHYER